MSEDLRYVRDKLTVDGIYSHTTETSPGQIKNTENTFIMDLAFI